MRVFYGFEFLEDGNTIAPISIGMVADDGRELYAVFAQLPEDRIALHPFLYEHTWPQLPVVPCPRGHRCLTRGRGHLDTDHPDVRSSAQIARMVSAFIKATPDVQLWADYAAYDHVALGQLFGPMLALPEHVPMFTHDLQQEAARHGNPPLPQMEPGTAHHALLAARHLPIIAAHLDARPPARPRSAQGHPA